MAAVTNDVTPSSAPPAPSSSGPAWHTLDATAAASHLLATSAGLTAAEAAGRLLTHGPNELQVQTRESAWRTLAAQFQNVLIVILLSATIISGFLGHTVEAVAITVIVLFAVLLGFFQEYRASRALDALREMAAPAAHVLRNSVEVTVPARELVPGDVVQLRAGDRVPADLRLIEAVNLAVDEAALTGESTPAQKITDAISTATMPIGDRRNMAYAGTNSVHGRGQGLVVATGMATEFGHIARLVVSVESSRTPLQINLDRLGATLGKAAMAVVALVVVVGLARGLPLIDMFMFGIALAVAVVPEALPAVVTISLAIGVRRMANRRALVRRLPIVETLGSTSVICSDKTGTLTKNEMTVRRLWLDERLIDVTGAGYETTGEFRDGDRRIEVTDQVRELASAAVLASDARLTKVDGRTRVTGDPTEGALVVLGIKAGLDPDDLTRRNARVGEIPFTSERRRMTTLHETADGVVAYSKGATEDILSRCVNVSQAGRSVPLGPDRRDAIRGIEQQLAGDGLRVLAIAEKHEARLDNAEAGMTLLGLVAMMDPPRPEALGAVQTSTAAGIRTVMITGDHPLTASSVARELGILNGQRVVTGLELEAMSDSDLDRDVDRIGVYARVTPADKLRVVGAWQKRGAIVAMTGDGVNDAPALKKADVGVAMGIAGTDVSKEAAGMTLLDDNFATIVAAVEEGRRVFGNIKKYLMYLLSCNVGEIILLAGSVIAGLPLPLTAVQILYVNLATDGLPALALAVDPPERDLMQRAPRDPRIGIFTRPVILILLTAGIWSAAINIGLLTWLLHAGRPTNEVMAMTFITLVLIQFFNAYNCRSDRLSAFQAPFANKWLNLAVVWELVLLVAIIYVPFLQPAFGTFALSAADWVLTAGLAFTIVPVIELVKWLTQRGRAE